jgi:hypothetical protein
MLMKNDKKSLATIIMGKMGPKPVEQSEDGAELDDSIGLKTAGEELLKAIESKSAMGVVDALKSLLELIESPEQEASEHESSEEPQE